MPYIKQGVRCEIDSRIDELISYLRSYDKDIGGIINYIITRVTTEALLPKEGMSYKAGSNMIKELECSKLEIYRRLVAPYEDKCIVKNGDLKVFKKGKQ